MQAERTPRHKPSAQPVLYCDELNINYGETCSRRAAWVYDKPGKPVMHFCTQHAPRRNRYCKRLELTP